MSNVVPYGRPGQTSAEPVRQPVQSLEAECALIGAVLLNNDAWHAVGSRVQAEHFVEEIHRRIWEVASALIRDGKVADPITLRTWLGEHDLGQGLTVPVYLARLAADATTVVNAPDYAQMVADLAERRRIIAAAQETLDRAYDAPVGYSVDQLVDDALASLHAIADSRPRAGEPSLADTLDSIVRRAQDRLDGKMPVIATTGLVDVDRTLGGGLRPGRLIVLAGRPGAGKTVLQTAIARRCAQKGSGVGLFSLEIDHDETFGRLCANALAGGMDPLDYRDITNANLTASQIERVSAVRAWFASLPMAVSTRKGLTMAQIESIAAKMGKAFVRQGRKLDVVVIDYLQLVQVTDRYRGNLVNEYGEVALAAKNMAGRLGCCVVLLSQLNRSVESRDNKRPTLSDLRGSGNIEEHADAVGMLYRPSYYDKNDPKVLAGDPEACERARGRENLLELIWEKNRLGPTMTDHLFCNVARSQVDTMSRHNAGGI